MPGLLGPCSLSRGAQQPCPACPVHTLLSRDSNASEVDDLELFMPGEGAGRGRARSTPWLPTLVAGLQGLAALLMFVPVGPSVQEQKRKSVCPHLNLLRDITEIHPHAPRAPLWSRRTSLQDGAAHRASYY